MSRNKKFKAEATAVPQMQQPGKIMLIKETKIPPNSDTAILKKNQTTKIRCLVRCPFLLYFLSFPSFSFTQFFCLSFVFFYYSFACFLKFVSFKNVLCWYYISFSYLLCGSILHMSLFNYWKIMLFIFTVSYSIIVGIQTLFCVTHACTR